ncbi:MAG: 16S rRNA (cytosine(967)-C(5))-methyltransferase RsmB [Eubacteriales bacterium]|nr:16S rRNA (cytosine(967)-C(5))-methyltransferase RsmB [Eubacteriales bacterium]
MNTRELVLDTFLEMEKTESFGDSLIRNVLDKYDYEDPKEKAFFKRLAEGTLERRITLDWAIDCYSKTPVRKMKPLIRNLLRLSAYQILYMEAVPDSAACNEAVKLAKKRGFSALGGFVNGVLRTLSREKNRLPWPDSEKEWEKSVSVRYSLPEWLAALWAGQYGKAKTEKLGAGICQKRPVIIRFGQSLTDEQRSSALAAIREMGVTAQKHPLYPYAFVLDGCDGVAALPGFSEGLFYVQDVSSMLAVECAGILPGMRVMDLCSAPGGKAILAYEKLMKNGGAKDGGECAEGVLRAGDVSERKAELIRGNAARMGCGNMEISVWDAAVHMERLDGWADVVLADVPCSGLGVMGRKKDIRYRVTAKDLESLTGLQRKILRASWQYVKPGGILLYSTCTVNKTENEEMVRWLTKRYPFETESLNAYLPSCLHSPQTESGMLQLLPGEHDTDGFFMARLRRKQ